MKDIFDFFIIIFIVILILLGLNSILGSHYRNTHKTEIRDTYKEQHGYTRYEQHVMDNQRTKNMTREERMDYYDMSVDERNRKYGK